MTTMTVLMITEGLAVAALMQAAISICRRKMTKRKLAAERLTALSITLPRYER